MKRREFIVSTAAVAVAGPCLATASPTYDAQDITVTWNGIDLTGFVLGGTICRKMGENDDSLRARITDGTGQY